MKRFFLPIGLAAFILFAVGHVFAQSTDPNLGLPLLDDSSSTPTASSTAVNNQTVTTYTTVVAGTTATTTANQSAVDDAETGSEVVVLVILSLTGGVGIFLIKKYFDFKRYSL